VTGVASLRVPFAAPLKATAGLPVSPGSDLLLPVTFAPTKKGTFTTRYVLHWSDVNGRQTLILTIIGTAVRRAEHEDTPED